MYCEAICEHPNETTATQCAKCGKALKPEWKGRCQNICGYTNESTATKCAKCGKKLVEIIDVTEQHYGIEVLGGKFEIVMRERTPVFAPPVKRTFYTAYPGQRKIYIPIYQGDKELAKDNAWQGVLISELPMGVPENTPVDVCMRINKDRLLEVEAECQGTRKSINIKPSDWAWSLREKKEWADKMIQHDYTDPEVHRVSELVKQGEKVLSEWDDIASPDSEEARNVSKEGKRVFAELERIQWRKQLQFVTDLLRRLLDYHALFDSTLVELLQTTMETCQVAQIKPDEISRDQAEEQLNRAFEKLFQDQVAKTLVIMILGFNEDSVEPNVKEIMEELKTVNRLIKEKKVDAAKEAIRKAERKPSFAYVRAMIFRNGFELPILLKSELGGYGREVETRGISI
jgi:hypothetical protein